MINVVFFASVREELGSSGLVLESSGINSVRDVITSLNSVKGSHFGQVLTGDNILTAVNQALVDVDSAVSDDDEVAFFPPVTGG